MSVLSERDVERIMRRQGLVIEQQQGPAPPPQKTDPPGLRKELIRLRSLIQQHARSGRYEQIVGATQNFFLAMLHLNWSGNRPINKDRVTWWRAAISENRWDDIEAFAFSWDGWMINGQHRATAFAEELGPQGTIDIWIKFGVDPKAFFSYDIGLPRSPAQTINLRGATDGGVITSLVRMQYRMSHGGMLPDPQLVGKLGEEMAALGGLESDRALVVSALVQSKNLYKTFKTPRSSSTLAYLLIARTSRRKLSVNDFWDKLHPRDTYGVVEDSPIDLLRKKLTREMNASRKERKQYLYQTQQAVWIIKGWNAWVNDTHPVFRWYNENDLPEIDGAAR
jgi:hypothetical protein